MCKGTSRYIKAWDHRIAFDLLLALGPHMIWNGLKPESGEAPDEAKKHSLVGLALAGLFSGVDALAAGVSLASFDTSIIMIVGVIGLQMQRSGGKDSVADGVRTGALFKAVP